MSVTFSIEANPTGAFEITCYDPEQGDVVVGTADSYEGILVERAAHMLVCDECAHYGCYSQAVMDVSDDLNVNVASGNARVLLNALGIDAETEDGEFGVGMMDSQQFLGAVLLAMASDRDDTGVRPLTTGGPGTGHATFVDCGMPAGYFGIRFEALHALATEAVRLGRPVVWA